MFRHKKRLDPFRIKPFRFILHHIQLYKAKYLVEMAGVEPETIKHYQLLLNYRL